VVTEAAAFPSLEDKDVFQLVIDDFNLPTANRFRGLTLREQMRLHKEAHTAVVQAFASAKIRLDPEHRKKGKHFQLTWRLRPNCLFQTRVICWPTIFRADSHDTDPHNYVFPLDKLFLDKLCLPSASKWRGLGLIPDDSAEWLYLIRPDVEYSAQRPAIILKFYANLIPDGLRAAT